MRDIGNIAIDANLGGTLTVHPQSVMSKHIQLEINHKSFPSILIMAPQSIKDTILELKRTINIYALGARTPRC